MSKLIKEAIELNNRNQFKDFTVNRLWEAIENKSLITETSLNRLMHHMESDQTKGYAFITPYRSPREDTEVESRNENERRWTEFSQLLRSKEIGFAQVWGHYLENELDKEGNVIPVLDAKGDMIPDEENGELVNGVKVKVKKVPVSEKVAFIPDIDKETAREIGKKYNQDSVLWGKKGVGNFYVFSNGGESKSIGDKIGTSQVEDYFTQVGGGLSRTGSLKSKEPKPGRLSKVKRRFSFMREEFVSPVKHGFVSHTLKEMWRNDFIDILVEQERRKGITQ